jgi:hypothetical protein
MVIGLSSGKAEVLGGIEIAEMGRSGAAPVHEVRRGCAEGKFLDEVEVVKAAPEGAALDMG